MFRKICSLLSRIFTPGCYVQYSSGSLSSAVKIYYDALILERLEPEVRHLKLAPRKRPLPKNAGNQIEFTRFRSLDAGGILTEGTAPTQLALSADKMTKTLRQLGDFIKVSDYVDMTMITPAIESAIEILKPQAAKSIDKYIRRCVSLVVRDAVKRSSLINDLKASEDITGITVRMHTGEDGYDGFSLRANKARVGHSALVSSIARTALTVKTVREAVNFLRSRDVEPFDDGYYKGIAYPTAIKTLREDASWKNWHQYTSPELMEKGEAGAVEAVRFFQSTQAARYALTGDTLDASSAALYGTLIFGKNAYTVTELGSLETYVKPPNQYNQENPLNQYSTVGWKVNMAAAVTNKSAGVIVLSTEKVA